MNLAIEARKLADYMEGLSLHKGETISNTAQPYTHIAGLFTNVVLQAGLNYRTVVRPRVERVISMYPQADKLEGFEKAISEEGLENIILWKHHEKLNRMNRLIDFSKRNGINTCEDLSNYLKNEMNHDAFLLIKGFGFKSLDYTLKLLSFDTIAVDRHIFSFVEQAGLEVIDYRTTKKIVEFAADLLQVTRSSIDYSIWTYMSTKDNNNPQTIIQF